MLVASEIFNLRELKLKVDGWKSTITVAQGK
jgi:hypothetical protein